MKTEVPGEKPLRAEKRTKKTQPMYGVKDGIKPRRVLSSLHKLSRLSKKVVVVLDEKKNNINSVLVIESFYFP